MRVWGKKIVSIAMAVVLACAFVPAAFADEASGEKAVIGSTTISLWVDLDEDEDLDEVYFGIEVPVYEGDTVHDVLMRLDNTNGVDYELVDGWQAVFSVKGNMYSMVEVDPASFVYKYWNLYVNDASASEGVTTLSVTDGDQIVFVYEIPLFDENYSAIMPSVDDVDSPDRDAANVLSDEIKKFAEGRTVATSDKKAIRALRAKFNALTAIQQSLVDSPVLEKLEADLSAAQDAAESQAVKENESLKTRIASLETEVSALAPKSVTINKKAVTVAAVKKALGKYTSSVKTVTLGSKVKAIKKNAFKGTQVKTIVVKTKKLTKKSIKNALSGSKVKSIKVKISKSKKAPSKTSKKYAKSYKRLFTKKIAGAKVSVKAA